MRTPFPAAVAAAAVALTGAIVAGPAAEPAHAVGLMTRPYVNDPDAVGANDIRYLVHDRFDAASAGSLVRVNSWNISDTYVTDAMIDAHRRGVNVRVIMARTNCNADLVAALGTNQTRRSWILCATGSTRGPGGTMHQKSLTFSSTGGSDHVTIVGSANLTEESWRDQWVDMFQFADRKDVYDAYNEVFAVQKLDDDASQNYFTASFNGGVGRANFYPVEDPTPDAGDDPVVDRLAGLPSNADTTIYVANYAFFGPRGAWIADRLIAKKQAGATVHVITGPPSGDDLEARLQDAGIPVTRAFDASCAGADHVELSCNYIHLKAMTATYVEGGVRRYRTFTGSDNWALNALSADEVTHRIGGRATHDAYVELFRTIEARYGA